MSEAPYRGLFPSPPLFDRMPTYRTQGKRSLNFLSAGKTRPTGRLDFSGPSAKTGDTLIVGFSTHS